MIQQTGTMLIGSIILICLGWQLGWAREKLIEVPLKSTADGQLYYVELAVGREEAKQTFNMLLATDYYTTWIPSIQLDPQRGYQDKLAKGIDTNYNLLATGTGAVGYKLIMRQDRVQIGQQTIEEQQFGVVSPSRFFNRFPIHANIDGMLALNGDGNFPRDVEHIFSNLHKLKLIDHLKYSLYLNKTAIASGQQPAGALVLGGVDKKYYSGDFNYVKSYVDPVDNKRYSIPCKYKSLLISGIQLDWTQTDPSKTGLPASITSERVDLEMRQLARLKLDSTTKLFIGDKLILDKIHLDIIGAKKIGSTTGVYAFNDCRLDNKPDIVFSVDGLELAITPEDYVIEDELENRTVCLSAFKPYGRELWVFGTRFLRKFYTVFDYEHDLVGFATPN